MPTQNVTKMSDRMISVILTSLVTMAVVGFAGWSISQINGNKEAIGDHSTVIARIDQRLLHIESDNEQIATDIRSLLASVVRIEATANGHRKQGSSP